MANAPDTPILTELATFVIDGRDFVSPVERFDRRVVTEEMIAARCADVTANRKAAVERIGYKSIAEHMDHAVYIISNQSNTAVKIGVTHNPIHRMQGVQNGSHEQLRFTHLFWTPKKAAYGLERFALRVAGKIGKRLVGEWLALNHDDAATIIALLALESSIPLSDSAMFVRNCRALASFVEYGGEFPSQNYATNPFTILSGRDGM